MENEKRFYVYAHFKPNSNECFYIGRGTKRRYKRKNGRSDYWNNIVNKYGGFEIIFLEENLTLKESNELEIYWISQMKTWGIDLCNLTDGGEGTKGFEPWNKNKITTQTVGDKNGMYGVRGENAPCFGRSGELHPMYGKKSSNAKEIVVDGITYSSIKEYCNYHNICMGTFYRRMKKNKINIENDYQTISCGIIINGIEYLSVKDYCEKHNINNGTFYRRLKKNMIVVNERFYLH